MRKILACCWLLSIISCTETKQNNFSIQETQQGIAITQSSSPVLFFQTAPKAVNGKFERAGYVHPLYDLNGKELTEDAPRDHPHQRGIFWAWHQVLWKGENIGDSWVSEKISFVPVATQTINNDSNVVINSEMMWRCDSAQSGSVNIIQEKASITIFAANELYRLIDFDIVLKPLVDSLAIGGSNDVKGYGGFSLRLKMPEDLQFKSGGDTVAAQETAVSAGPWLNFTGTYNPDAFAGVTLFCAKPFPGPAQQWILRTGQAPSMQNALFPGRDPLLLPADGWQLRYRLVVHDGNLGEEKLQELYQQYIHQ